MTSRLRSFLVTVIALAALALTAVASGQPGPGQNAAILYEQGDIVGAAQALSVARSSAVLQGRDLAMLLNWTAIVDLADGKAAEAEKELAEAIAILGRAGPSETDEIRTLRNNRAVALSVMGRNDEAISIHGLNLASRQALAGDAATVTLNTLNNRAAALWRGNALEKAYDLISMAEQASLKTGADKSAQLLRSAILGNLATITASTLRPAKALPVARKALEISQAQLGERHPRAINDRIRAASFADSEAVADAADTLRKEMRRAVELSLVDPRPATGIAVRDFVSHIDLTDPAQAFPEITDRIRGKEVLGFAGEIESAVAYGNPFANGAPADPLWEYALNLRERYGPKGGLGIQYRNYAYYLSQNGRKEKALKYDLLALQDFRRTMGIGDSVIAGDVERVTGMLRAQGRGAEADALAAERSAAGPLSKEADALEGAAFDSGVTPAKAVEISDRKIALYRRLYGEKSYRMATALREKSYFLQLLGREEETRQLLDQSLALMRESVGPRYGETVTTLLIYARLLDSMDRTEEAVPLIREAIRATGEGANYTDNDFISTYIDILLRSGEQKSALAWADWQLERLDAQNAYNRAFAKKQKAIAASGGVPSIYFEGESVSTGELSDKIKVLSALGRFAEAEPLGRMVRDKAAQTYKGGYDFFLGPLIYGKTLFNVGKFAEAEAAFVEAGRILKGFGNRSNIEGGADAAIWLARARLAQPARAPFAFEAIDGLRANDLSGVLPGAQAARGFQFLIADAAWARGPATLPLRDAAFMSLQAAMDGVTTRAVAQTAARRAAEAIGPALGAIAREREALENQRRLADRDLVAAQGQGDAGGESTRSEARGRIAAIDAQLAKIDARLRTEAPAYFALISPETLGAAEAQAMLAPDEAALLAVPTPLGTHVMIVTREGLNWHRAALTSEQMDAQVRALRLSLDQKLDEDTKHYLTPFDRKAAFALYQDLIAPGEAALKGKTHLFVAAAGPLAPLPFSVLITDPPQGPDDDAAALRGSAWLSDRFALVQIPSLQSLKLLRARPAGAGTADVSARAFDGFGDPVLAEEAPQQNGVGSSATEMLFAGARGRGGEVLADIASLKNLPSLPQTADELENIRASLSAPADSVRLRKAATETAVRRADLSHSRILAFATHGVLAGDVDGPVESGLVLTPPEVATPEDDGLLTASEITTLKLDADWVILSACNTASGDGKGDGALSGLARAFFYAGGHSLLASHWPVRDDVASRITVETIRSQKPGQTRAQAFQAAMRTIREDAKDPSKAHPAAWAPFVLVGDK